MKIMTPKKSTKAVKKSAKKKTTKKTTKKKSIVALIGSILFIKI